MKTNQFNLALLLTLLGTFLCPAPLLRAATCPTCGGRGSKTVQQDGIWSSQSRTIHCTKCGGSGQIGSSSTPRTAASSASSRSSGADTMLQGLSSSLLSTALGSSSSSMGRDLGVQLGTALLENIFPDGSRPNENQRLQEQEAIRNARFKEAEAARRRQESYTRLMNTWMFSDGAVDLREAKTHTVDPNRVRGAASQNNSSAPTDSITPPRPEDMQYLYPDEQSSRWPGPKNPDERLINPISEPERYQAWEAKDKAFRERLQQERNAAASDAAANKTSSQSQTIQGLNQQLKDKDTQIKSLEQRLSDLEARMNPSTR